MGGERLSRADLGPQGIEGDRQYGLVDAVSGLPAVPEKHARWRKALHLQAVAREGAPPLIVFPNGRACPLDDPSFNAILSDYFGFATAIAAYEHTDRRCGLPLTRFRTEHFAMHLLTTASLESLARLRQVAAIDSRRFRPTVLIETSHGGFPENQWIGRRLRLGAIRLKAEEDTKRCGVTFISQPGLAEDPEILRSIMRHNRRNLGIYCSIDGAGTLQPGDELFVEG